MNSIAEIIEFRNDAHFKLSSIISQERDHDAIAEQALDRAQLDNVLL